MTHVVWCMLRELQRRRPRRARPDVRVHDGSRPRAPRKPAVLHGVALGHVGPGLAKDSVVFLHIRPGLARVDWQPETFKGKHEDESEWTLIYQVSPGRARQRLPRACSVVCWRWRLARTLACQRAGDWGSTRASGALGPSERGCRERMRLR